MKPITLLGQPVLRQRAKPLRAMPVQRLRKLIRDMIESMVHTGGVGIAAPQIGVGLRAFIIASRPNSRYPSAPRMKPLTMINPRLLRHSKATQIGWEGCLSIPGIRGRVPRYRRVEVEYSNLDGERRRIMLNGFVARIFQHEFDHINGKVFLDRVPDTRWLISEAEYLKLFRRPGRKRAKR